MGAEVAEHRAAVDEGQVALVERGGQARLVGEVTGAGQVERGGHDRLLQHPRPQDHADRARVAADLAEHLRRGQDAADVGGDQQERGRGAAQRLGRGGVEVTGQIDDHEVEAASARLEHRAHRSGWDRLHLTPVEGEDGQLAEGGKRGLQRRRAHPPFARDEVGPSGAFGLLLPEQDVDAAAEGVGVDQQRAELAPRGRQREAGRQQAGTRASVAAHDTDHDPCPRGRLQRVGELLDQPQLTLGQFDHALGAHGDASPPAVGIAALPGGQEDLRPARRP
ncbi:hypothetical protein GCM10020219_026700 [Nonomuraea dietziae]